jgi:cell division protein FtsB
MSAARSYAPGIVTKRSAIEPRLAASPPPTVDDVDAGDSVDAGDGADASGGREPVDLSALSIAGIGRRHVAWVASALVSAWIVVIFARQVGDASTAATRAEELAADNAALAAEVHSLEGEVALIVRPEYVAEAARGYQLGDEHEIPFTLDRSVPGAVDGAPGSASVRLGATTDRPTPLESWLSLLFGPGG